MKYILFCNFPYAFGILKPIADQLSALKQDYIWYVPSQFLFSFQFDDEPTCSSLQELYEYPSDVIFAPGNSVPWYLSGLKVQVFHGLAGEKKGHFSIRDYFDLYLTQGPYFTERFNQLEQKHGNFQVIETGWCKLDPLFLKAQQYRKVNQDFSILYAPTFSPSLTSAIKLFNVIECLAGIPRVNIRIKFHDKMVQKMGQELVDSYKVLASHNSNITFVTNPDITDELVRADLMISDTSSVVYEFLLLDKPVITLNSTSDHIVWDNVTTAKEVLSHTKLYIEGSDPYANKRQSIIAQYHPYNDGNSALRMINAANDYIKQHGIPQYRKLGFMRKLSNYRVFRYLPSFKFWFK